MMGSHTSQALWKMTRTFMWRQALDLVGVSHFELCLNFHIMPFERLRLRWNHANVRAEWPIVSLWCPLWWAPLHVRFLFVHLQIPVACKSCPCGYVFISRKLLNAKLNERSSPAITGIAPGQRNLSKVISWLCCLHRFVWPNANRNGAYSGFIHGVTQNQHQTWLRYSSIRTDSSFFFLIVLIVLTIFPTIFKTMNETQTHSCGCVIPCCM